MRPWKDPSAVLLYILNVIASVLIFLLFEYLNRKKLEKSGGNETILKVLTKKEFDKKEGYKFSQFSNSDNSLKKTDQLSQNNKLLGHEI